jgi:hypothetical protein
MTPMAKLVEALTIVLCPRPGERVGRLRNCHRRLWQR